MVAGGMESMTNAPHLLPGSRAGLQVRRRRSARPHGARRSDRRVRPDRHGRVRPSGTTPRLGHHPRGAGRVRRALATSGPPPRRRTGCFDDGDRPGRDPAAQGRPGRGHRRRGHPRRRPPPSRWPGCARRSRKDGTITAGSSSPISDGAGAVVVMSKAKAEAARADLARRDRRARQRGRPGQLAALASRPTRSGTRCDKAGLDRRRPRPDRDQRGVRGGRRRSRCGSSGVDRETRQRQRRRDRARPPDRHVRRPARAAPGAGAATAAAAASARPRCAAAAARATR